MRLGRFPFFGVPAAIFSSSSTVSPSTRLAQRFLIGHVGTEILEVNLQLAIFDLSPKPVHGARWRTGDALPTRFELPAMTWADKLVVIGLPGHAAT
jgi:hypothetical protein